MTRFHNIMILRFYDLKIVLFELIGFSLSAMKIKYSLFVLTVYSLEIQGFYDFTIPRFHIIITRFLKIVLFEFKLIGLSLSVMKIKLVFSAYSLEIQGFYYSTIRR